MDSSHAYPQIEQRGKPNSHMSHLATVALRTSSALPASKTMLWGEAGDSVQSLSIPRSPTSPLERTGKVELPSIRQAIPEIQLRLKRDSELNPRDDFSAHSPLSAADIAPFTFDQPPSPTHYKRRKTSLDEGSENESRGLGDYRRSPQSRLTPARALPPKDPMTGMNASSSIDGWKNNSRFSPPTASRRITELRSPPSFDAINIHPEWRPTLPSLPALTFEQGSSQTQRRLSNWHEYSFRTDRSGAQTYPQSSASFEPPHSSHLSQTPSYGYQQPRYQSFSGSSSLPYDRPPFPSSRHHPQEYGRGAQMYGVETNDANDAKQRKRRGNLPKETTNKLRAWFIGHLQHPYPTEEEKQDLMRQTGLQMNQISNWFINARRRQLPAMINNARAESDARSTGISQRVDGMGDLGDERDKRSQPHMIESDGESYDEDYDTGAKDQGQSVLKNDVV